MKDYESLNWALERVVGPELRYLMAEFVKEYPEDVGLINSFEGWLVDKEIEVFNYKKLLNIKEDELQEHVLDDNEESLLGNFHIENHDGINL